MVNKWGGQTKYDYNGKVIEEGITIDEIFEEVPIRIHNSALVSSPPQPLANDALSGERGGVYPPHPLAGISHVELKCSEATAGGGDVAAAVRPRWPWPAGRQCARRAAPRPALVWFGRSVLGAYARVRAPPGERDALRLGVRGDDGGEDGLRL